MNNKGVEHFQFVVLKAERVRIIANMHDSIWHGHLGIDKTSQKIRVRFY